MTLGNARADRAMQGVCRPLTTKSHHLRLIRRPDVPHFPVRYTSRCGLAKEPTEAQASASRHQILLTKDTGASVQRGSSREGAGKKNAPDSSCQRCSACCSCQFIGFLSCCKAHVHLFSLWRAVLGEKPSGQRR